MSSVREKHKDVIEGLSRYYECLVALTFIQPSDVLYAPHTSPGFDVAQLQSHNLDEEAIALIQELPYLNNKLVYGTIALRGVKIAPDTRPINYFRESSDRWGYPSSLRHPRRGGFHLEAGREERDLDAWMLRLTDGEFDGIHLIYNVRDHTIVSWCHAKHELTKIYWYDLPSEPVATVLSTWHTNLLSLFWAPLDLFNSTGWDIDIEQQPLYLTDPSIVDHFSATPEEYEYLIFTIKSQANYYLAVKRLYISNGWPDNFQKADFEKEGAKFKERYRVARRAVSSAVSDIVPPAYVSDTEMNEVANEALKLAQVEYARFVREWAGDGAI